MTLARREALLPALLVPYMAFHAVTWARYHPFWYDETFFASMAEAVGTTGEFNVPVATLRYPGPLLIYGPVYFVLTGGLVRIFGVDPFWYRLPGLIFGLLVLVLFNALLRHRGVDFRVRVAACVLFALDPTFAQSFHKGRMEPLVLTLLLSAILFLLKSRDATGRHAIGWSLLSGVAAGLALLTTPRPAFVLGAMGVVMVTRAARTRSTRPLLHAALWGTVVATLYACWMRWAFGTPGELVRYFSAFVAEYAGRKPPHARQVPLLMVTVGLFAWLAARAPAKVARDDLLLVCVLSIGGFYVFVTGDGSLIYSQLMVPFAYLACAIAASELLSLQRHTARVALRLAFAALLLVNSTIFVGRNVLAILEWHRRDPESPEELVRRYVLPGSKVIGDEPYYYAVRRGGSDFKFFEGALIKGMKLSLDERIAFYKAYGAEYVITEKSEDDEALRRCVEELSLVRVGAIDERPLLFGAEAPLRALLDRLGLPSDYISEGYVATVYARADLAKRVAAGQ